MDRGVRAVATASSGSPATAIGGPAPRARAAAAALRIAALGLAVALLAGGCEVFAPEDTAPPATPVTSGIRGIVTIAPTCEGATLASPCAAPYSARLIVLDMDGAIVGETTSADDGSFELILPPGAYTIQPVPPDNGDLFPVAQPVPVIVGEGELTEVGIDYDSGLR